MEHDLHVRRFLDAPAVKLGDAPDRRGLHAGARVTARIGSTSSGGCPSGKRATSIEVVPRELRQPERPLGTLVIGNQLLPGERPAVEVGLFERAAVASP